MQPDAQPYRKNPRTQQQPEVPITELSDEDLVLLQQEYERRRQAAMLAQQQQAQQAALPQQKMYTLEQVEIIKIVDAIDSILIEMPLTALKQQRLLDARDFLLYYGKMPEFILAHQQEQPPQPEPQQPPTPEPAHDPAVDPDFVPEDERGLDKITSKLNDLDAGILKPEPVEPEKTGIKKFLPSFGKKKPEKEVRDEHQPESMG